MTDKDGEEKVYTLNDVSTHTTRESCWLVIHGKVYDVAAFLNDHPGGDDIILENAGGDATGEFEDIGHSTSARDQLAEYKIGVCREKDPKVEAKQEEQNNFPPVVKRNGGVSIIRLILPLIFLAIALFYNYYKTPARADTS